MSRVRRSADRDSVPLLLQSQSHARTERGVRLKRNRLGADEEECDATPQGVVPLLNEGRLSRAALNP